MPVGQLLKATLHEVGRLATRCLEAMAKLEATDRPVRLGPSHALRAFGYKGKQVRGLVDRPVYPEADAVSMLVRSVLRNGTGAPLKRPLEVSLG